MNLPFWQPAPDVHDPPALTVGGARFFALEPSTFDAAWVAFAATFFVTTVFVAACLAPAPFALFFDPAFADDGVLAVAPPPPSRR